jgi:multiple sugar transport system permease protein
LNSPLWSTVGTLLDWLGYVLALRCIWLVFLFISKRPDVDRQSVLRRLVLTAVICTLSLWAGMALVGSAAKGWRLPLVWWVMPFPAWLAVGAQVLFWLSTYHALFALLREEKVRRAKAAIGWLLLTLAGVAWYSSDPGNSISELRGAIPLSTPTVLGFVFIAIAGIGAMTLTTHMGAERKVAKRVVMQLALIAGSIVFGIPLLFLLITSFKEDRDMSSPNGIVWVPRVQQTVAYVDPKDPVYEVRYEGQNVQATIASRLSNGLLRLEVQKPFSLQGLIIDTKNPQLKPVPQQVPLVTAHLNGLLATAMVVEQMEDGRVRVKALSPPSVKGQEAVFTPDQVEPIRNVGLRWQNYPEALSYMPPETEYGLVYLKNTLLIAILSVLGTVLSSSLAAYAFARLRFPGRDAIFAIFLATMMLPAAVTMMPQFLIYRQLGWIDTLLPLWVPAFFGSALNIFLLRQFFRTIPMEFEDAAKIDGCSHARTFWSVMLPQIKPALAVIGVTTFMAAWNNFMGPLIYINSSSKMPISYALQLYNGDRGNEPGLLMAFVTLTIIPVLLLFFFAQRYFIEGVTLSGLGGK